MSIVDSPIEQIAGNKESNISRDEIFETLSNERRRCVVRYMLANSNPTDLRTLSRQIASREYEKPVREVTPEERRRVYNALQQFHLQKLDDIGAIRYDPNRGTVEPGDSLKKLELYLDASEQCGKRCLFSMIFGGTVTGAIVALLIGSQLPLALLAMTLGLSLGTVVMANRYFTESWA